MSRSIRTLITFAVLAGGFVAYGKLFGVVAERIQPSFQTPLQLPELSPSLSASAREAAELAIRVFGKDHWTTHSDKRYYNVERGYWMYWDKFERPEEHGGRRIEFSPFAVIWRSKNDSSVKVIAGDRAIVEFDQPFELFKPGPKPGLVYARIEGTNDNVFIQDDKGTSEPSDDLVVTLPYAEYFEREMKIQCSEEVHLTDRDVTVQGRGLLINLRPNEGGQGFPGAERVRLERQVLVQAEDVGKTGIMPGSARPEQQVPGNGAEAPKTPVMLSSDGEMILELPRPSIPPWVGPPAPAPPTIAKFARNVVIKRGTGLPDQINGDNLTAILVPREKTTGAAEPDGAAESGLGGLTLLEARVDGHAVWLQSEAERLKVRGNELIYRKPGPNEPEKSYFRADKGKKLYMERVEVDEQNQLKSLLIIWAVDATLHGSPDGQGGSSVVARGPGWLEQRSGPNQPVERWAKWTDELIVDGVSRPNLNAGSTSASTERTYITLKGDPMVDDPAQVTLAARDEMVICLEPSPNAPSASSAAPSLASNTAQTASETPEAPARQSYRIEWITASGDVHMITPETTPEGTPSAEGRRTLNARDQLQVVFDYPQAPAVTRRAAIADSVIQPVAYQTQASPGDADASDNLAAEPLPQDEATAVPVKEAQGLDVEANLVWARVVMDGTGGMNLSAMSGAGPGGSAGRDVREVRLRGDVRVHQAPAQGQTQGLDLSAAAVDVQNGGPGRLKMFAHGEPDRNARVVSPELTIQGPILLVDQARHYAKVQGAGDLTMQASRNSLGGMSLAADSRPVDLTDDSSDDSEKKPVVIQWGQEMEFFGTYPDTQGRPGPARALFVSDVKAQMADDRVNCQELEAIFDQPVSFDRPLPGARSASSESSGSPRPEVQAVIARRDVHIISLMREEDGSPREQREVIGPAVTFERPTGSFWVDDAGTVLITSVDGAESSGAAGLGNAAQRPVPRRENDRGLTQTRVDFRKSMQGQIGMDDQGKTNGYREATFFGDVQVLRGPVDGYSERLNQDRPPADSMAMEADRLNLETDPAVPAVRQAERTLMKAYGNAQARTSGDVIQGDTIVYDSLTSLVYIRGTNAPVTIMSQGAVGQPFSQARGRALVYNPKTKQSRLLDPSSMQIFDPGSGSRIGPDKPSKPTPPEKPKRPEPRLPARGDLERRGFSGS